MTYDKNTEIETFLHYSDPTARQERTVFGAPRQGLFYNYDDRLIGDKWTEGAKAAQETAGIVVGSARYFEIILSHFHGKPVSLEHVVLGCNMSNGYSYLVFGYTY